MKQLAFLSTALLWLGCASTLAADRDAVLQAAVDAMRLELDVRGVAATVIFPDDMRWTGSSGEAAAGVPVEPETAFETGSISKLYTAAVVLLLVDRGVLALDETLDNWVPEFDNAEAITLRQLLQHASGIFSVHDDPEFMPRLFMEPAHHWRVEELLDFVAEPHFPPGEGWRYSNTNYLLLGLVVERATGRPFAENLRRLILEPLALERTWFAAAEDPELPRAHAFLDFDGDGVPDDLSALMPDTAFLTSAWTAGAVIASSGDVARFTRALLGDASILSTDSRRAMLSFVDRPDGKQYGLGVLREVLGETTVIGHRGNSMGFSAVTWHAPDSGVTLTILTNGHGVVVHPSDHALLGTALHPMPSPAVVQARQAAAREDQAEVIRLLEPKVEAEPDNPELLTLLSRAYIQSLSVRSPIQTYHRSKRLVEYLERAIELDPSYAEPRWLLFNFLLQAPPMVGGDRDRSKAVAEALVEVDPDRGRLALEKYSRHTGDTVAADR